MEVKGFLKKIMAMVVIATLMLPSFSTVLAYSNETKLAKVGDTANFGISLLGANGWGYKIQNRKVYRIYEGNKDYTRNVYCLDFTKKFPKEDSASGNYTNKGEYTGANKERLALMAENMYITSMDQADKDRILNKMFADLIQRTSGDANPVTLDYIKKTLVEDDIVFAQQCAIWKYTNNQTWQGASIWMTNKENPGDKDWYQISNIGQARYAFMQEIYAYLTSNNLVSESSITNPSLVKNEKTSTEVSDGYIVGPFHIKSGSNKDFTVKLTDQAGSEIDGYKLVDKNGDRLSTTLDKTLDKDFYVKVPLKTTATKVVLTLKYANYKTTKTSWTTTSNSNQPLLEIDREKVPGQDVDQAPIDKPEKLYDLALRKYIVKVGDKEITDRTPNVTYNTQDNEINYKHKKDPIVLNPGDTVVYNITVYNEGNQKGTATRVKDYLPEGLTFVKNSDINKKYGWIASQDGKYVATAYPRNYTLEPYNKETNKISSVTMQIECKVSDNFKSGILTNLAEIIEDDIDDIDSVPASIDIDKVDLPDYKGKDSNKDDLTDKTYFYRGQEDDDDFEKVEVKDIKLDLSLRKYITTVNGTNQNREPKVDIKPLVDKTDTTAIYTHSKTPVTVKKGDVVIYSIRVYNEGDVDAYANEVTDYLPEELGLLVNHTINYDNGWKVQGESKIVKLNTIEGASKNLSTSDFTGITSLDDVDVITGRVAIKTNKLQFGNTNNVIKAFDGKELSSKVLQVACVVLTDELKEGTIKNIAAVTEEVDEEGKVREDRDSQPTEIDVANYPDNTNIQDDDDFEKLIVNKKFDLSLRKFITAINGEETDARIPQVSYTNGEFVYAHPKDPLLVKTGDIVTYTIRVYNEGELAGYASLIEDDMPEGLKYLPENEINVKYGWKMMDSDGNETTDLTKAVSIQTDYRSFEKDANENIIPAFVSGTPSYVDVKVAFEVVAESKSDKTIINTAEVADDQDEEGKPVEDIDSTPGNHEENEDDIDKEYVELKPGIYDLAIIKFLSSVEGKDINPSRLRNVDTKPLQEGKTDAIYTLVKDPVKVKYSNVATYTIRVYNEGTVDAIVSEVRDSMPDGLEFIKDSEINKQYKWHEENGELRTDYTDGKVIKAFNKETGEIDYIELRVEFKLVSKEATIIENVAEITKDDGDDIDSTPDNDKPEEDDQDFDRIIPAVYDLALKKFITKINDRDITSRIPMVSMDEDGNLSYNNSKEPLTVTNKSVIVYTIRTYNEGTTEAFVEEVRDNIPDGLVFLPDNEVNQKYGWKLYDENGNETDDVSKAVEIRTKYLSKEESAARKENNELKAFDKEAGVSKNNPDYRDVEVAFEVDQSKMGVGDRKITNIAEITDDNGDDIDSTPDNDNPEEDDQDYEEVELKYFDLSLVKYVTQVIVNENGSVKKIETGHNGTENPEPVVKVELNRKILDKTQVSYVYRIRVTNEGEIEGYAKEIKDRIPAGLEFYQEDNPGWKISEDGIVTTDLLKDTLLKPGESAEVTIVLRWKNSANNLGTKINTAEISKDENEYNTPDIDSTPDNNIEGEDDQDTAPVVLSVSTGAEPTYIVLTITVMTILATGCYAIKKFVLE